MSIHTRVAGISLALVVAVPVATLAPLPGWSQGIEEITVTTRRREENLQEVPIAVTPISAQKIDREGILNLADVAMQDTSVQFDNSYGPADTRIAIRGLSNTRGRSNVAFLVDGVDTTTENVIAAGSGLLVNQRLLRDVERIEIVKGPQSALYGRAAFAGALSYTTKNPSDELEIGLRADGADYDQYEISGYISGPLGETWGGRLDAVSWTSDGFYNNAESLGGQNLGGGDGAGASATLTWDPTDTLFFKTRVAYSEDKYDPRPLARVEGLEYTRYPIDMINVGIGVGSQFAVFPFGSTGVANAGAYCQGFDGIPGQGGTPNPLTGIGDPTAYPGYCLAGNFGTADGKKPTLSRDMYNRENPGAEQDVLRWTLNAEWDTGEWGSWTYTGGYTDADASDQHDQDFQDVMGLVSGDPGYFLAQQQADTETETMQLSNEIRFASSFDGPVNFTAGYLYWKQKIDTVDRNFIVACAPVSASQTPLITAATLGPDYNNPENPDGLNTITTVGLNEGGGTGICDGTQNTYFINDTGTGLFQFGQTITPDDWRTVARQLANDNGKIPATKWDADTDHRSIYGMLNWDISQSWRFTLESRYVNEESYVSRPNQANCSKIGFGIGDTPTEGPPGPPFPNPDGVPNAFNILIDDQQLLAPSGGQQPYVNECQSVTGVGFHEIQDGTETSYYNTPKMTLEWFATDDAMAYFSWAKAQKPGGINLLSGGGARQGDAGSIDESRYDPEKMQSWELGTKTSWVAAGALVVNGAVFFNDYTDKQVTTQVLRDGQLNPIVQNASAAEVWGLEVETQWIPSFLPDWMFGLQYTWQDAEYTDFIDDTTSVLRIASTGDCSTVVWKGGQGPNPDDLTDPANGDPFCQINLSGNKLERAPEHSLRFDADVTRPLGGTGMEWFFHFDANYQDSRFIDSENVAFLDSYWLANSYIGLEGDKWDVQLYATNLFDDDTVKTGGSGPDFGKQVTNLGFTAGFGVNNWFAVLPPPRVVGLRVNYRWGQ